MRGAPTLSRRPGRQAGGLMMVSRQVVADVEQRYGDRVSIIASAMAGRPVSRPAKLALVTTSSLYEAYGSSQYNRLRVDTDKGPLVYRKVAGPSSAPSSSLRTPSTR